MDDARELALAGSADAASNPREPMPSRGPGQTCQTPSLGHFVRACAPSHTTLPAALENPRKDRVTPVPTCRALPESVLPGVTAAPMSAAA